MLTRSAALLVGLLLGVAPSTGAVAHDDAPSSYDELPVGAQTTLSWWQRGELHLGATVIRTERSDVRARHGTTVVASDPDRRLGRPTQWFLVDGNRLRRLPMKAPSESPLISADGRWLAWLEGRARRVGPDERVIRYRVVVYDVDRQRVANSFRDRRLVEWGDGINGIWLRTLSNAGRLVLSQGSDGVKVFSPRGRPVRFGGPQLGNGVELDGWPLGTTYFRSKYERSVYGVVGRDGSFQRAGAFTVSFAGSWSPDGQRYAYGDADRSTYWVRSVSGDALQLGFHDEGYDEVGWESATDVVLWRFVDYGSKPSSRLVRCSAVTGACEQVPDGPRADSPAVMAH